MILNTGDVPNIYESDEKAEITEQVNVFFYSCGFLTCCSKNSILLQILDFDRKILENVYVFIRGFNSDFTYTRHLV